MRQGQQSRRGRGRGRKVQNPLARNFESNGPDVKIRGTAAHIAEKYAALARDAAASGDIVQAENYLQHAEHYNRIIMAAQGQLGPGAPNQPEGANGAGGHRHRRPHGMDEGQRTGHDNMSGGDDMDDMGEPYRQVDVASRDMSEGDSDVERRRRSNGAGNEGDEESKTPSEDAPDSVVA